MIFIVTVVCLVGGFLSGIIYYRGLARSSGVFLKDKSFGRYYIWYLARLSLVLVLFYQMIILDILYFAAGFFAFIAGRFYIMRKGS